jgi:hypothetical protein
MLTRQFLPGYFQPPLPGLDRDDRQGITQCCKTAVSTEIFSVIENYICEMA